MLSETTAVRNAWAASERELQLRITINDQVFNAEDVTDFSYDAGAMNGESLTLGSTYANSIKITFSHIVEKLKLEDKITPEIGIKLPDDTWSYTKLGVFIIDSEVKQDRNNGQTSLSATDNMVMLSGNYTSKIAYPTGVIESITDIANQAGVKLNEANIARLTDTTIGALGKEVTYRQAIGYVAQIAGGFAQFNRDGLLDIRGLEDPNFRITSDCYMSKGLTKNETFYRIGGMQAEVTTTQTDNDGNENQETVTLQSGSPSGSQIKLTNPAMSQQLLDQLYDQYADINFYPYSLEWFADPNLEAGDWVTIVDNKGNEFKAPALGLTLSFNGGLSGTLKADTTVTSQATFVYSGQFNQVVTRLHNDFATIAGNHIYKGIDQPIFAKKGDLWYQSVGPDTVMQVYQFDPDTGLYSWVEVGSTKPSRELSDQMDQVKKDITDQSTKIDGAVANANTAVSNSDLATKTASSLTSQISSVKDGLTTKYTQLQQTLDGVQVTANNAVTQAQLSLTANTFTNTIAGVNDTLANLSARNYYQVNTQINVLTGAPVINHNETVNGFKITGISGQLSSVRVKNVITSNGWWTFSFDLHANQATSIIVDFCGLSPTTVKVTKDVKRCTVSINVTNYSDVYNFIDISNLGWAYFWFDNVTVQKGKADLGWTPAPEDQATVADVSSQFTQMQDDINLRVKTGDLISQINVESGETLIESASGKGVLNLSAATVNFSGEAFIPAASIKDLSADYIKTGTLDASKVNLISVNADSITAGIITGDNLSINLDSGEILFQKGSIKSVPGRWNNALDIEIEDGTFSQADYRGNGVRFQDGSIYMTRDVLDWKSDNKGVKGKVDYGTVRYSSSFLNDVPGMMIYGSEGIVVGTSNYTIISPFQYSWSISGSGMSACQQGLALGSSEKVVIGSGQEYVAGAAIYKPTIMVGTTNSYTAPGDWTAGGSNDPAGNGISLLAKSIVLNVEDSVGGNELGNVKMGGLALACDGRSGYVLSATTYERTYSGSANMIITENGVYGRVTSARKYKLLDHDAETVIDHAKRILDINPKQWFDKAEVETISQSLTNSTESQLMTDYKFQQYYGFIADDFHAAGLDEVVQFKNGEVDSLAYDRIPMYHNVILKDHETRIEKLERENKELKQQLAAIS
ncbi:hypothetical protein [Lapidilactobacillus gannanensis]|uniref:Peptidase S74 domain-containing protein n=1 Tax=Lapidilactobacillus gannanensis TaxID=2486002 RepID=A0ABW4BQG2_9LACO|nr:hypothetical protein [Lapidilactobacillus gannanensis]